MTIQNGTWQQLMDAAAMTRILQSAVLSQEVSPDADDVCLMLAKINQLILDAADKLDQGDEA